jgi:hypothetical protein
VQILPVATPPVEPKSASERAVGQEDLP